MLKKGLKVIGKIKINGNCRGEKGLWLGSQADNEETAQVNQIKSSVPIGLKMEI